MPNDLCNRIFYSILLLSLFSVQPMALKRQIKQSSKIHKKTFRKSDLQALVGSGTSMVPKIMTI